MIREYKNKMDLTGKVVSVDVREGENAKGLYLAGKMIIQVGTDEIPVDFFANQKKNDGGENPLYKNFATIASDYQTIAKVGQENADIVSIGAGQIAENTFPSQKGGFIQSFNVRAPFFNRQSPNTEPVNKFVIEGEFLSFNRVEEDGIPSPSKAKVKVLTLGYNGRPNVLELYLNDEKGVAFIETNFVSGQIAIIEGRVEYSEEETIKKVEAGFGGAIEEKSIKTVSQLVMTKMSTPSSSPLEEDEKTQILTQREALLQKKKDDAEKKNKNANVKKPTSAQNFTL